MKSWRFLGSSRIEPPSAPKENAFYHETHEAHKK
jgi:hypothetical protein